MDILDRVRRDHQGHSNPTFRLLGENMMTDEYESVLKAIKQSLEYHNASCDCKFPVIEKQDLEAALRLLEKQRADVNHWRTTQSLEEDK